MTDAVEKFRNSVIDTIKNDIAYGGRYPKYLANSRDVYWLPAEDGNAQEYHYPGPEQRIKILLENFAPIPASKKRAQMHRIAYVYPREIPENRRPHKNAHDLFTVPAHFELPRVVNDPRVKNSLPEALAHYARNLSSMNRKIACIFLSGERGAGKSAFLNHLFSTNHVVFEDHRIVWIRLDLTRPEAINVPLLTLLQSHGHEILVNKYIDGGNVPIKKEYFSDDDYDLALDAFSKRSSELSVSDFNFWLQNKADLLDDQGIRLDPTPFLKVNFSFRDSELSHEERASRFRVYSAFLRERDQPYSFIFVIDGLDESTTALIKTEALKRWQSSIDKITRGDGCPQGLYIICAREQSFKDLVDHMAAAAGPHDVNEWYVWPVDFYDVIQKRVELFKARAENHEKDDKVEYWKGESGEYIVGLTTEIIEYTFRDIGIKDDLLRVFSQLGHMRALMRFFQDAITEVLGILDEAYQGESVDLWLPLIAEIVKKRPDIGEVFKKRLFARSYRIWHISSLNYLDHYSKASEFLLGYKLAPPTRSAEFPLIPILWGDLELPHKSGYFGNHLLLKIRILECLLAQPGDKAPVASLVSTMAAMFEFYRPHILIYIKEMILQRFINFDDDQYFFKPFEDSVVKVTDVGRRAFNTWLSIPDYTEHTMQMSTIPHIIRHDFKRFIIRRSKNLGSGGAAFRAPQYLPKTFRALAKFLGLIAVTEEWENTRIRVWKQRSSANGFHDPDVLNFDPRPVADRIRPEVTNMVNRIVSAAANDTESMRNIEILRKLAEEYRLTLPQELAWQSSSGLKS